MILPYLLNSLFKMLYYLLFIQNDINEYDSCIRAGQPTRSTQNPDEFREKSLIRLAQGIVSSWYSKMAALSCWQAIPYYYRSNVGWVYVQWQTICKSKDRKGSTLMLWAVLCWHPNTAREKTIEFQTPSQDIVLIFKVGLI